MNANLHPTLAAALLPFAPPQSVVHQVVQDYQWLRDLNRLNANERQSLRREVMDQNGYIERTGGLL